MKIHNLKHGDLVVLEGNRGYVGTAAGMSFDIGSQGEDPRISLEYAKSHKHDTLWINKVGACICGDPGHYEREDAKWAGAIVIAHGDRAWIEGQFLAVVYKGQYSDMGCFVEPEDWTCKNGHRVVGSVGSFKHNQRIHRCPECGDEHITHVAAI